MSNMLKNKIMQIANDLETVKTYDVREIIVVDADLFHDIHISVEIMKCENRDYLISESDIEIPSNYFLSSKYIPTDLIIDSIHDWTELETNHYHIVSTRATNLNKLIKLIRWFFNIHKYIKKSY